MYEDGYSDTTDSSPTTATVRRKPLKPTLKMNSTESGEGKKQSSKDFIPQPQTSHDMSEPPEPPQSHKQGTKPRPPSAPKAPKKEQRSRSQEEEEDEEEEDYDDVGKIEGIYNPNDYANLTVSADIKELFSYITQVQVPPLNSVSEVKLHPFIPDYYPSVGDIDAFLKVTEPGVKDDGLGIQALDEPAPFQSDPSVLDLRLRALAKQSSAKSVTVKKVENLGKNTKVIENWIKDISDLHRSKPSPSVHYSKPMPDLDYLLQEWSPEMEDLMKDLQLPGPDLSCDLATYVDVVCSLLDIPVYKSRIQSLHVLFTLFTTMKQFSNQFNGNMKQDEFMGVANSLRIMDDESGNPDGVDRFTMQ